MDTPVPGFLVAAAEEFGKNNTPLYLVGGWPRNRLLGLPPGDLDTGSALPPAEALELFKRVPCVRIAERDTRLGTFGALCEGYEAEYTAFRTESYGAGGAHRPDEVRFGATMREDALRRDFTANALYFDIVAGKYIDPLGGLPDAEARILRTCRRPEVTFADDGLRLMRLARFACELGFGIDAETFETARQKAGLIEDIAPERVQAELDKILLSDTKYPGLRQDVSPVLKGLRLLDSLGLLGRIAPEFNACRGVAQRPDYHDHDVLEHLFRTAACAPSLLNLRLSALLHDIGKPAALKRTGKMLGHDKLGEGIARDMLTRLRYPNAAVDGIAALIAGHMYDLDGRTGEGRLRLFFVRLGRERSRMLAELRRADVCGSREEQSPDDPAEKWIRLLDWMDNEKVPWTERELHVDGNALAALAGGPSPLVGKLKRALHEHAVLHPRENEEGTLLRLASSMLNDRKRFGR